MATLQCPLSLQALLDSKQPMGLQHLQEIEEHVTNQSAVCHCPHPPLKELVFDDELIRGSTPLLMACLYGELASVKRIIQHWGVNLNQAATYYLHPFDGEFKIELASPLFVAANAVYLKIVRYLLNKGANVSAEASGGKSPIYGALSDYPGRRRLPTKEDREVVGAIVRVLLEAGADPNEHALHLDAGNPMWMSSLCGISAVAALIDYGLVVNHRFPDEGCGNTLLSYWAGRAWSSTKEESLAVVKLLLANGADVNVLDGCGLSPIIRAAHYQNLAVLELLLKRNDISRKEKIEALELAGAVILEDRRGRNAPLFYKAFGYWRRSLRLRMMDQQDGCGPITKETELEWATSEELELIIQSNEFKLQSFLVRSRILSARSWIALKSFLFFDIGDLQFLTYYNEPLLEQGRLGDLLVIGWSLLKMMGRFHVLEKDLWSETQTVVDLLTYILVHLQSNDDPLLNVATIKTSLELILATDRFHLDADPESPDFQQLKSSMNHSMIKFIGMLSDRPQLLNKEIMEFLSVWIVRDIRRRPYGGSLLLHLACRDLSINNRLATVRLLLQFGADPDAADDDGNRPHHVLARFNPTDEATARLLLVGGAFFGRLNNGGNTAADLWKEIHRLDDVAQLPSWLEDSDPVPKLKNQCGRTVRSNKIHHLQLPQSLRNFVELKPEGNENPEV